MNRPSLKAFIIKFIECFFFAFALFNAFSWLIFKPISLSAGNLKRMLPFLQLFLFFLVIACVLFIVVYPIVWQIREKKGKLKSEKYHAFFVASIRLWLAVMICTYGFAKILGTQFTEDIVRDNMLAKNLSGFDLTWLYFGHSYPFAVTIAICQLTGAALLLFRKTVFLGVCILLPVMLNIVLINFFYGIETSAEINAVFYALALIFLLCLFGKEIKAVITSTSKVLPGIKTAGMLKYFFRVLAIGYAFMLIRYYTTLKYSNFLTGKWMVETMIKGSDTVSSTAWLTDSTAWKNIYLNEYGNFVANPNPYVIERKRAAKGEFHYDGKSNILSLLIGAPKSRKDHFEFRVSQAKGNGMIWVGQHEGVTWQLSLTQAK